MVRACEACGKVQRSSSGFERHRQRCKSKLRMLPRTDKSQSLTLNPRSKEKTLLTASCSAMVIDTQSSSLISIEAAKRTDYERIKGTESLGNQDGYLQNEDWTGGNILLLDCLSDNTSNLKPGEVDPTLNEGSSKSHRGLLSTSSQSILVQTFEEVTGRRAGTVTTRASFSTQPFDPISCPFHSPFDYFFATWLRSSGISKGNVDRLLKDSRAGPLVQYLSFENSSEWHEKIGALSQGMKANWQATKLSVQSQFTGQEEQENIVIYQDILEAIKFLLGHGPFQDNLVYEAVQHKNSMGHRVYSEMNTGEWWWETQAALPDNATVVPLLLATDKTLLTQHHGDTTAWPVYLTIGNLDRSTRRSQKRPGQILIGFLPVMAKDNEDVKAKVWHMAMGLILKPIEQAARNGIEILCADGAWRMCFPVIASFAADYEEQVIITGVKSGRQCTICMIESDERENLDLRSPPRTHQGTQEQIKKQNKENIKKGDKEWVHPVENFAWKHAHLNIHQAMTLDPLHQLLKGVFKHLMEWIMKEINVTVKADRKKTGTKLDIAQANAVARLDERFKRVHKFQDLHVFQAFSQVQQWTGNEERSLVKQIIPVFAPLLLPKSPHVLQLARAIVEFIILANYVSHDDETLRYLDHALFRINIYKAAASKFRHDGHFNFPKFHIMSHYPDFIRKYGAADNFDTEHGEASHKYHVKAFYFLTNKHASYLQQIVWHSVRRINAIASEDIELYKKTVLSNLTREQTDSCATTPARAFPLTLIPGLTQPDDRNRAIHAGLNPNIWCTASTLAKCVDIPMLLISLALFIRRQREELSGLAPEMCNGDKIEKDVSWMKNFLVSVHGSLKCWSRTGKCSKDTEKLEPHYVRCKPDWQSTGSWRKDWVWVQETPYFEGSSNVLNGRLPGQLTIIVTVQDAERYIPGTRKPQTYTGALIEVLRPRNNGKISEVHGMIEVERWPDGMGGGRRVLGCKRFYSMPTILRSVHLVPVSLGNDRTFFVNNYIDWDSFNTLYDENWEEIGSRAALKFKARKQSSRT